MDGGGYATALKARSAEKAKASASTVPKKKKDAPVRAAVEKAQQKKDKVPAVVPISEESEDEVPLNRRKSKPRADPAEVTEVATGEATGAATAETMPVTRANDGDAVRVETEVCQPDPQVEMETGPSQANPMQIGVGMPSDVPPLQDSAVDPQDGEGGEDDGENEGNQESSCPRGRKRPSVADLVAEERAATRQKTNHYSVLCDYQGSDYIFRHGGASAALVSQISELEKPAASFRDLTFPEAYEEFASSELQHIGKKNRLISLYDDKVKALQAEVAQQKAELEAAKKEAEEIKGIVSRVTDKAMEREQKIKDLNDRVEAEVKGRRDDVSLLIGANQKVLAEKAELQRKVKATEEKLELESQRLRKSRTDEVHKMEVDMIRRANARLKRVKAKVDDLIAHSDAKVRAGEVCGLLACLKQIEKDGVEIPEDLMAFVAKDAEELKQKLEATKYEPMPDTLFDFGMNDPEDMGGRAGVVIRDQHGSNAGLISPQDAAQLRDDVQSA